jgi:hypothetical protein
VPLVLRLPGHQSDRRCRLGYVPPAPIPDLRQVDQLIAVGYDHEIPGLPVSRGWRSPPRFKDVLKVLPGDRLVGVLAHVAARPDGVPRLYAIVLSHGRHAIEPGQPMLSRTWRRTRRPRGQRLRNAETVDLLGVDTDKGIAESGPEV